MTWTLIDTPSLEELAWGYTPAPPFFASPQSPRPTSEAGEMRRYLVTVFAIFGLLACLQGLASDHPADGQRRLAELNLSERKTECRGCQNLSTLSAEPDL